MIAITDDIRCTTVLLCYPELCASMYMQFPEMPTHLLDLEVIYSSRYIDVEVIGKHYCTMGGERKLA